MNSVPNRTAAAKRRSFARSQQGLSLIELMIAIALGVILMLGIVEIFGATRAAYQTSAGLSRVQENGRFAMDFLRKDMRMAAQWGCFNEYAPNREFYNRLSATGDGADADFLFRSDLPIEAFEYSGTAPGDSDLELTEAPTAAAALAEWSPEPPADLGFLVADGAVANSDVLVLRYLEAEGIPLVGTDLAGGAGVTPRIALENDPDVIGDIDLNMVYGATDCKQVSLFELRSQLPDADMNGDGTNDAVFGLDTGGGSLNQLLAIPGEDNFFGRPREVDASGDPLGEASPVSRYRVVVYYVAIGTGGEPSLFRRELEPGAGSAQISAAQELVEGVESLQLTFGVSQETLLDPTAVKKVDLVPLQGVGADDYVTAETLASGVANPSLYVQQWRRVKKMRASIIVRSPEGSAVDVVDQVYQAGDTRFTVAEQDSKVREVYETVVAVRNRS